MLSLKMQSLTSTSGRPATAERPRGSKGIPKGLQRDSKGPSKGHYCMSRTSWAVRPSLRAGLQHGRHRSAGTQPTFSRKIRLLTLPTKMDPESAQRNFSLLTVERTRKLLPRMCWCSSNQYEKNFKHSCTRITKGHMVSINHASEYEGNYQKIPWTLLA